MCQHLFITTTTTTIGINILGNLETYKEKKKFLIFCVRVLILI